LLADLESLFPSPLCWLMLVSSDVLSCGAMLSERILTQC